MRLATDQMAALYALMRPSEVAALTREGCHLPETGRGYLIFADSSPAAGKAYEPEGPQAVRKVRIPPELTDKALIPNGQLCYEYGH